MKIALTGLITRQIGPVTYGGTEALTYNLVEGLVKNKHSVNLYASSDSQTSAQNKGIIDSKTARLESMGEKLSLPYYLLLSQKLAREASSYDVIHNNFFTMYLFSAFSPFIKTPLIHTIHNAFYQEKMWAEVLRKFLSHNEHEHVVFVSEFAKKLAGDIYNSHVVYNGIDVSTFPFVDSKGSSLLWLGRMTPEKGPSEAVQAALKTQKKLLLVMAMDKASQKDYFQKEVEPYLNQDIQKREFATSTERNNAYQNARALLVPISWEEPFGLVMVEAMACGTPVIAYARGAVPEIVQDGVTGFIVNPSDEDKRGDFIIKKTGMDGFCEAIERIYALPESEYGKMRRACRSHVEKSFTVEQMVENYEKLYQKIVQS